MSIYFIKMNSFVIKLISLLKNELELMLFNLIDLKLKLRHLPESTEST